MSAILLDTCALLWLGNGDAALSQDALRAIGNVDTVYVSPVSLWEVSNKCRLGKLVLLKPVREWFDKVCARHGLTTLPLTNEIIALRGNAARLVA